jgi:hypothetical protein
MATSSSDESSTAPRDFHIPSSVDSGSRLSLSKQKCLLCCNSRRVFYCKDCIHSGLFYHSKHQVSESYLDKRKTLLELEDSKKTLEKKCLKYCEPRQKADVLVRSFLLSLTRRDDRILNCSILKSDSIEIEIELSNLQWKRKNRSVLNTSPT